TFDESWYRDLNRNFNGAFYCVAPEFLRKDFLDSLQMNAGAFDCWAMGLLLYRLCTKKTLNLAKSVGEYSELIYSGALRNHIWDQVDENVPNFHFNFLIKHLLQPDEKIRIKFWPALNYANYIRLQN